MNDAEIQRLHEVGRRHGLHDYWEDHQDATISLDVLEVIHDDTALDPLHRYVAGAAIFVVQNHRDWLRSKIEGQLQIEGFSWERWVEYCGGSPRQERFRP